MNILKALARRILKTELTTLAGMSVSTVEQQRALAIKSQEVEELKVDLFQSSQIIHHHEQRIQQMAPEKQFVVVAPNGLVLEQEMVYSSDGKTRITVKLPLGHPYKQLTELEQQLELANLSLDRARIAIGNDTEMRRNFLGLDKPLKAPATAQRHGFGSPNSCSALYGQGVDGNCPICGEPKKDHG